MVTVPEELEAARALLDVEVASPRSRRRAGDAAAARHHGRGAGGRPRRRAFDAAFFSIGSNDLTQYVTAAGRDIGAVADLADPLNPAVLRLIADGRGARRAPVGARSACAATPAAIRG